MKIEYRTKEWTRDFIGNPGNVAVIGGKGCGKTTISALWVLQQAIYTDGKGLITLNTKQQLRDIFQQNLKPLLTKAPIVEKVNKNEGNIRFKNGNVIHLRSAEAAQRVEGLEYNWWWGDEIQDYSPENIALFFSRTRKNPKRIRVTGMPADPEAFMYSWIDKAGFDLYEINVRDNPDPKFAKEYEEVLRQTYSGAMLDRYLEGKRVSLTGLGLFNIKNDHRKTVDYAPSKDLYFCWDFNVIYRAVTAWQIVGKTEKGHPLLGCVDAYQMDEPTTYEDAQKLAKYWAPHQQRVFLHGDASGDNRTASTSDTMWQQVKKGFKEQFENQVRYIVPRANPNVKDTIQILNWALTNDLILFDPKASVAFRSVSAAKADKYGEIDKSNDDSPDGANTHEMDTVRYMAHHVFEKHLPGSGSKSSITKLKGT